MHAFEALADPVRRRIVDILASGEHTAGQLAEVVGREFRISRTAVSKHVRSLRDAGYVAGRAEESWRWYRLTAEGLERLEEAVSEVRAKYAGAIGWDADAGRFRDPLARLPQYRSAPFRGPGRPSRRGRRGTQTTFPSFSSPDDEPPPPPPIHLPYAPPGPKRPGRA